VLVAVSSLSPRPTQIVRKLAVRTASALQSNFDCAAMRSPTMTPTSDIVDLIQAFSAIFGMQTSRQESPSEQSAPYKLPPTCSCSTHKMPKFNTQRREPTHTGAPTRAESEGVPVEVRIFLRTACEEVKLRVLPATHSINPPLKPQEVVSIMCGTFCYACRHLST
jgi:hypothetical protein